MPSPLASLFLFLFLSLNASFFLVPELLPYLGLVQPPVLQELEERKARRRLEEDEHREKLRVKRKRRKKNKGVRTEEIVERRKKERE